MQVDGEATETTQPDKERNSCLQLTALRLTAFHLPGRLSLAEQWQRAGWLSPETGGRCRQEGEEAGPAWGGGGCCLSSQDMQAARPPQPAADVERLWRIILCVDDCVSIGKQQVFTLKKNYNELLIYTSINQSQTHYVE